MSETRKTRPQYSQYQGRAVDAGTGQATTSTQNDITPAAERQQFRIADFLHPGAENAISRRDLMALTDMSDRELRLQIEAERRQGCPILSNCVNGYYLPGDQAERDCCVRSLRRRAKEIEVTAAAIEKAVVPG